MKRNEAKEKARQLVAKMTIEEAASQLCFDAPAIERLGIPAYNWWNEALHGVARAGTATSFPQAIGIAAAFDPELTESLGDIASTEGRAKYNAAARHGDRDIYKGLTFWSPNVNIFRDPRWGRGHETFGEDPYLTAETGAAYVRGIQGSGDTLKAAACAKHFAVHSGPENLRHRFNAEASAKDMEETYLPAFHRLTDEGVEAVMGAYNRTNGEPCCASSALMDILRNKWGFEGHFLSDCWAIQDFHMFHKVTDSPESSAALALKTGCDLNCGCTYRSVMSAYQMGLLSEEDIRRSAVRLFTTRYLLGVIEGSEYDSIDYKTVECEQHIAKALEAAEKSCVLLKNDGILPIDTKKYRTIGVIGPNANSRSSLIGNYHGTSSRYITVLEGLQDAAGNGVRILYSEGCHLFKDRVEPLAQANDRISEAVTVAEESDIVILVVGLDESLEGEEGDAGNAYQSGDKKDLLLPESQRILMDKVLSAGTPVIICLMAGSSIDLGEAAEKASALLLTWYPGARGGKAVADILLGKVSPSGKLPVTFYHNDQLSHMPDFTDYSMKGRTYRYIEEEPLYPFGYGLTYGDCHAADCSVEGLDIRVKAVNTSCTGTDDVLQLYLQNVGSRNAPKNPRLVGYKRIHLNAGETKEILLSIDPESTKVVNDAGERIEEGDLILYAGFGQPDPLTEKLTGHKAIRIKLA